ncbi:hypothetical protein [Arcanobacterium hippocoleae]|uniref:hypothetical protein n=1 Tax=Arcanobacterium hippocoleae TaxID=149017 RepID=UPI00333FA279
MNAFTTDRQTITAHPDQAHLILRERKVELARIEREGRCTKNGFRRQCLAQEWACLKS